MEIAETVSPYFVKNKRFGSEPIRFISVKTIEYESDYIGDINQFNITVEYLSDQGKWKQPLIIRQFSSIIQFDDEIRMHKQMENELQFHKHIRVLPIIYMDDEETYVVYEGGKGRNIDDFNFDEDLHEYIVGMLCAVIQGNDVRDNDMENISNMIEYLLSISGFTLDQQKAIFDLITIHYLILAHSKSGYHTLSVLNTKYVWFNLLTPLDHITKYNITNFTAFDIEILYIPPQFTINDRMIDLAMRYGEDAFEEFSNFGNVKNTQNRLISFLEGYELEYEQNSYYPLEEIYEFGLTLDLQIIIVSWLYMRHLTSSYSDNKEIKKILKNKEYNFIIYLLTKRPFQFYDVDPSWYDELGKRAKDRSIEN